MVGQVRCWTSVTNWDSSLFHHVCHLSCGCTCTQNVRFPLLFQASEGFTKSSVGLPSPLGFVFVVFFFVFVFVCYYSCFLPFPTGTITVSPKHLKLHFLEPKISATSVWLSFTPGKIHSKIGPWKVDRLHRHPSREAASATLVPF